VIDRAAGRLLQRGEPATTGNRQTAAAWRPPLPFASAARALRTLLLLLTLLLALLLALLLKLLTRS